MCHYTHLTPLEQEKILFFLAEGKSVTEIAHLLNRSKSTISRELRRNAAPADQPMSYCPLTAQTLYKWTGRSGTCLVKRPRVRPPLPSTR